MSIGFGLQVISGLWLMGINLDVGMDILIANSILQGMAIGIIWVPLTIASFATRQHALLYVVLILWIAASAPAAKASFSTVNAMETSVWR